jgi:cation diffusion facilitator CzcD-associated flavoprotein CzcO
LRCRNTATDRSTPASRIGTNRISRREEFAGQHVLVVGGGASAVQLLAEISEVARTTWVTRQPPEWRTDEEFGPELGRSVVAKVEEGGSAPAYRREASSA